MQYFFDKKCTISNTTIVNIDWEDIKSYTPIYTDIECDFFVPDNKYRNNKQAREFETEELTVVLKWDKTLVEKWQTISLIDSLWMDFWEYVINDVAVYKNINWVIDNITLSVSQRYVS